MNEIELVVFDLAGTTVKDDGQVPEAFTAALKEHGIEVTPEQLSRVRGSSKREAIARLVAESPDHERRAASVYASFRKRLAERYTRGGVEPIDGARDVFEWLRQRRVRVALNTGFDRDTTNLLLSALRWDDAVVDAVVCGDDVRQGRPAPYLIFHAMERTGTTRAQQVASVGDTRLDLEAGHNAGVRWNIGVLSGAHGREVLEPAPHTHLLPSIAGLRELWQAT